MNNNKKVDVCINVFGKPYQTIVTLKSLLLHSGIWIDKIFLIEEQNQPSDYNFDLISEKLNYDGLIRYKPEHWYPWHSTSSNINFLRNNQSYLQSIRYEYGLIQTNKKYMLLVHNDLLFKDDIVGHYLNQFDYDYFGMGEVGQCWNCPLYYANLCNGNLLESNIKNDEYDYNKIINIFRNHPPARRESITRINVNKPMPLPECRINEWCAMINVEIYRKEVIPNGNCHPVGGHFHYIGMDVGDVWFREMVDLGYKFKNIDTKNFYSHGYFSTELFDINSGHHALMNQDNYKRLEEQAKIYFENNF